MEEVLAIQDPANFPQLVFLDSERVCASLPNSVQATAIELAATHFAARPSETINLLCFIFDTLTCHLTSTSSTPAFSLSVQKPIPAATLIGWIKSISRGEFVVVSPDRFAETIASEHRLKFLFATKYATLSFNSVNFCSLLPPPSFQFFKKTHSPTILMREHSENGGSDIARSVPVCSLLDRISRL